MNKVRKQSLSKIYNQIIDIMDMLQEVYEEE